MAEDFVRNHPDRPPSPHPAPAAVRIVRLESVDSTNLEAERLIAAGDAIAPVMVIASRQTAGQGRRATAWSSPTGGLWATLAWPLDHPADPTLHALGLRLGLACLRAIRPFAPDATLKWPNDILIGSRKVCGCMGRLLTAPDARRWILAAAGINANNPIDPALADRAISLRDHAGAPIDLPRLESLLADHLAAALAAPGLDAPTIRAANEALAGVGRPIRLRDAGRTIEGTLLALGDRATPRVRLADGSVIEAGPSAEMLHDE